MQRTDIDFDEAVVDDEFIRRKLEMAERISELRRKRIKLRQELVAYKKYEKNKEKPMEDPALATQVLKLESEIKSEKELNSNLQGREQTIINQLNEIKKQIHNTTDLIQRYKVENASDLLNSNSLDHLKERKQQLIQTFKTKKQKLNELENDLKRLTKESDIKQKQSEVVTQIEKWQEGTAAEATDPAFVQQAYVSYQSANESWREAKFNYDRKNLLPDFYELSLKAIVNGIDAHFILLTKNDDVSNISLREKVVLLYKNKIVVNTTLMDSLVKFVERIGHHGGKAVANIPAALPTGFILKLFNGYRIAKIAFSGDECSCKSKKE